MTLHLTAIGLDVGGTKIAGGLVDGEGTILTARRIQLDRGSGDGDRPLEQLTVLIEELRRTAEAGGHEVCACGLAVPAFVDCTRGIVVWAPNIPGWRDLPLAALLRERTGLPLFLDHDGPAAILGEQWLGAARGTRDAVLLIIGTGIGAGYVLNGRVYRGGHGMAGGVGWSRLGLEEPDDPHSREVGYLEALAAGPGIARRYLREAGRTDTVRTEEVFALASGGDAAARRVLAETCRYIGLAAANLVSAFDPEVLILGGGVGANLGPYLAEIEAVVRAAAQPQAADRVRLATAALGNDAGFLGAARLALAGAGAPVGIY